jgi:phosphoribosylformylglycinamidine cyclo-ligase
MKYESSGVNIDAGNKAVELIKSDVRKTHSPNVLGSLGGFAAGFKFDSALYKDPILVSCTDGVGTKLRIAIELNKFDSIGIDLVAMCVNDLICMGATPLFFLDYIACHELIPEQIKEIVSGIVSGCQESQTSLIGGEMAEMNDMYRKGDFDLAGFCVGVVDRNKVIDGTQIKPGNHVYGLPSSGIHSNGFSLVRKVLTHTVCDDNGIDYSQLLTPTRIYVNDIKTYINSAKITGISHITGGGIAENLVRILPPSVSISIARHAIPELDIFNSIQTLGNVDHDEMYRVFNMGVGMILISEDKLPKSSELFYLAEVQQGNGTVTLID